MDERLTTYLDGTLSIQNLYEGKIKGYILDSMVSDDNMYQLEDGFTYCNYEEILNSEPAFAGKYGKMA